MSRRDLIHYAVVGIVGAGVFIAACWIAGAVAFALGIEAGVVEP